MCYHSYVPRLTGGSFPGTGNGLVVLMWFWTVSCALWDAWSLEWPEAKERDSSSYSLAQDPKLNDDLIILQIVLSMRMLGGSLTGRLYIEWCGGHHIYFVSDPLPTHFCRCQWFRSMFEAGRQGLDPFLIQLKITKAFLLKSYFPKDKK